MPEWINKRLCWGLLYLQSIFSWIFLSFSRPLTPISALLHKPILFYWILKLFRRSQISSSSKMRWQISLGPQIGFQKALSLETGQRNLLKACDWAQLLDVDGSVTLNKFNITTLTLPPTLKYHWNVQKCNSLRNTQTSLRRIHRNAMTLIAPHWLWIYAHFALNNKHQRKSFALHILMRSDRLFMRDRI